MDRQYHHSTLALAGELYVVSPSAIVALDGLKTTCNIAAPASLREWYALDAAVDLLKRHSSDIPYAVTELGLPNGPYGELDPAELGPHPINDQNLLPFMIENQGVCYWGVRLDGSPDPEVLIAYDDFGSWLPHAESFSDFVYSWVWDRPADFRQKADSRYAFSQGERLAPGDLEVVADLFERRPKTMYGLAEIAGQCHRFAGSGDKQRVRIGENLSGGPWECQLWAATDDLLAELITTLHSRTGLTQNLQALDRGSAADRVISEVLPGPTGGSV